MINNLFWFLWFISESDTLAGRHWESDQLMLRIITENKMNTYCRHLLVVRISQCKNSKFILRIITENESYIQYLVRRISLSEKCKLAWVSLQRRRAVSNSSRNFTDQEINKFWFFFADVHITMKLCMWKKFHAVTKLTQPTSAELLCSNIQRWVVETLKGQ